MGRGLNGFAKIMVVFGVLVGVFLAAGPGLTTAAQAASWSFVDGGSVSTDDTVFEQLPSAAVYGSKLYVAWYEYYASTSASTNPGIRIRSYDGTSWSAVSSVAQNGQLVEGARTENISINQIRPALASYSGNLYAAYAENNDFWGNSRIHVKKFDGSSWSNANNNQYNVDNMNNGTTGVAVNPYPCTTINVSFNADATNPTLLAANGKLYVAWAEIGEVCTTGPGGTTCSFNNKYNVRVAALDTAVDSDWRMIDGGGHTGLNYDTNRDAVQAITPCMAWFNGKLYVGWSEYTTSAYILHVKSYDPGSGTWTFVDGGGLNYGSSTSAYNPQLAVFNNALYATWTENTYGSDYEVRYKKYSGNDTSPSWTDDGSSDGSGWNREKLYTADLRTSGYPAGVASNNLFYYIWSENPTGSPTPPYNGESQIHVASTAFNAMARTFIDGNLDTGLNSAPSTYMGIEPQLAIFNGDLYGVWHETDGSSVDWIRVSKYILPRVTSVGVPANGNYKLGDNLDFTVNFSKAVTVTGLPYLPVTLDTGGTVHAAYQSGSGTTALVFSYTVKSGDLDTTGITVGTSLNLNGGNFRDNDSNDADLTLNSVPSTASILVDGVPPAINSAALAASNGYLDINFSEGVYGAGDGVTALTAGKLALTFTRNGGGAANVAISSVKKNDSTVEGSASALTGGETVVRVFLSITGTPSGVETIEVRPSGAASINDHAGNSMDAAQTTGIKTLNDKTPPTPVSAARTDDTHITVTLSENCANITKANDGGFAAHQTGSPATTYAVNSIAQGADASHVILTVANIGASVGTGVTVTYTAGGNGTIQDTSGNAMATNAMGVGVPSWKLASVTTVTGSGAPADFGQTVTFTAAVTGSGATPTGMVDFMDGATTLCPGVSLTGSGQASCGVSTLATGSHTVSAVYSGDGVYMGGSGSVVQTVLPAAPVAAAATGITDAGFSANWGAVSGATGYYLDVSEDSAFTTFVSGFSGKDVGNAVTATVGGLAPGVTYFYRLRAYDGDGPSPNSNIISQATLPGRVTGIVIDPNTFGRLFATVDGAGVYVSADSGGSWNPTTGQPASNRLKAMLIRAPANTVFFAATYGSGVFSSADGGSTWSACTGQPANHNVLSLACDASGNLYAGTEGGIFTSTDCGTWTAVNGGLTPDPSSTPPVTIVIDPTTSSTLYAGLDGAGVWKSTNSGGAWSKASTQPTNLRVKVLVISKTDNTKLFAATYGGGVFKSSNSGVDWTACADSGLIGTALNMLSLTIDASGKLYAGTEAGVFVSCDGCGTWTGMDSGLP
ncbi:MAG TPA: Ig-like domain repeat protein [Geobacteraceae bacterium]|nr:Ig-like domain repeat protein [Geobacteraceae bacterium]